MPTGILGGTFDPPHKAHLALALSALETGKIDRVVLIPAKSPPHKSRSDMLPAKTRLEMVNLLAAEDSRLSVSDIELKRSGESFTYLTLHELKEIYPAEDFRLIIGADMALIFGSWKNASDILKIAPPLVAARPGYEFPEGFGSSLPRELSAGERQKLADGVFYMQELDVSSTYIRDNIKNIKAQDMLTRPVFEYITSNNLYV